MTEHTYTPGDAVRDATSADAPRLILIRDPLDGYLVGARGSIDGEDGNLGILFLEASKAKLLCAGYIPREKALRVWKGLPESAKDAVRQGIRDARAAETRSKETS